MLPGPVFQIELLTSSRRPRHFVLRFLYGLALLGWIGWSYYIMRRFDDMSDEITPRAMSIFGSALVGGLFGMQAMTVLGLTPALVAGTIVEEKRRKTLHDLLTTPLSSAEIVVGKMLARLLHVGVFLTLGLPIMSLLTLFGGVDPLLLALGYAATASSAFFLASASILISTQSDRPRDALTSAYAFGFAWIFGPALIEWLAASTRSTWFEGFTQLLLYPNRIVAMSAPFAPLIEASRGRAGFDALPAQIGQMIALQLAFSVVLIGLAILRLRPAYRNYGVEKARPWSRRRTGEARPRRRWLFPRPECSERPILWKELHVGGPKGAFRILRLLFLGSMLGWLIYGFCVYAPEAYLEAIQHGFGSDVSRSRDEFNAFIRSVSTLLFVGLMVNLAGATAGSITSEREGDTWISLVATPLPPDEILKGKLFGPILSARVGFAVLVALGLAGLFCGAVHPLGFVAMMAELTVFTAFVASLGLYTSLRARTTLRAQATTLGIFFWLSGGMVCCVGLGSTLLLIIWISPIAAFAISHASYREIQWSFSGPISGYGPLGCLAGLALYSVATATLLSLSYRRFDRLVDRPARPAQPHPQAARRGSKPAVEERVIELG